MKDYQAIIRYKTVCIYTKARTRREAQKKIRAAIRSRQSSTLVDWRKTLIDQLV